MSRLVLVQLANWHPPLIGGIQDWRRYVLLLNDVGMEHFIEGGATSDYKIGARFEDRMNERVKLYERALSVKAERIPLLSLESGK